MSSKLMVALITGLIAQMVAGTALADGPYQDVWGRYTVMLWPYQTPAPGPKLKAAMDSVGVLGAQLDGAGSGVSKNRLDFVLKYDVPFYLGHGASKGYLHLYKPDDKKAISRQREPVARPHCFSNPATMAAMKKALRDNIRAVKKAKCVGHSFDDEVSMVSFTSPCDTCTSQWCLPKYRKALKAMYGSIDKLNAQWGTNHKNFRQIGVVGCEATRVANHPKPLNQWNLSGWVDSREYIDWLFADTMRELTEYSNQLDPARPAGYVGGGGPTAYGGYDYEKIAKAIQWIEAYDIGGSMEILRSLMPNSPSVQTWFDNGSTEKNKWYNWYYWAHGGRGQIIWPSTGDDSPWFDGNGKPRPDIAGLKDTMVELQGDTLGPMLVDATFADDGIALYYGQPSVRVSWMIDIIPHGGTWINRMSSMNNDNDCSHWNRYGWMKAIEDAGFQYSYVSPGQISSGELVKKGYKVLILGRALALSDAEATAIKAFAAGGGMVIADHLCGIFDEHGKARPQPALAELFGVSHDLTKGVLNGKVLYEVDGELHYGGSIEKKVTTAYDGAPRVDGMVVYERGLKATSGKAGKTVGGIPAIVRNGRAVYLNLSPVAHTYQRYDADGGSWPALITRLLAEAGIKPRARVVNAASGKGEPIAECIYWTLADGRNVVCVVKNRFRKATITGAGTSRGAVSDKPMRVRVEFAAPVKGLTNVRTGKVIGDTSVAELDWPTSEGLVLSYK